MDNNIKSSIDRINKLLMRKEILNKLLNIDDKYNNKIKYELAPGIVNKGNTCFHNSVAQLFYRIPELTLFLIHNNVKNQYKESSNIRSFIELLTNMHNNSNNDINVNNAIDNLSMVSGACNAIKKWKIGTQYDAEELLNKLLSQMSIECNYDSLNKDTIDLKILPKDFCKKIDNKYIIQKVFPPNDPRNFLKVKIEKARCKLDIKFPPNCLELKDNKYTINENCADKYINDNKHKIKLCNNIEVKDTQYSNIYQFQSNTSFDSVESYIKYLSNPVIDNRIYLKDNSNPPLLNAYVQSDIISPNKYIIITLGLFTFDGKKQFHKMRLCNDDDELKINNNIYEMIGMVVHIGSSINNGHYINYIKYDNKWYYYSDSERREQHYKMNKDEPYIVLYKLKSDIEFETIDPNSIGDDLSKYLVDN